MKEGFAADDVTAAEGPEAASLAWVVVGADWSKYGMVFRRFAPI